MEETTVNPYQAPESNLDRIAPTSKAGNFKRFSAWGVFGLTVITLGIYYIYWLYTRATIANSIHDNKISPTLLKVFIGLAIASFVTSFVDPSPLVAIINLSYFVVFLICLFKLKKRLEDILAKNLSPVLTFFFSAIYLQYKINETIDNEKSTE